MEWMKITTSIARVYVEKYPVNTWISRLYLSLLFLFAHCLVYYCFFFYIMNHRTHQYLHIPISRK